MKKFIILICLLVIPVFSVSAVTKEDIINYVESKESQICDSKSKAMFKSYKLLYERMLSERSLTESELDQIYSKIKSAVDLTLNNGVCSINDTSISSSTKNKIYDYLYSGAMIIYEAPSIDGKKSKSTVVIDKSNNKISLYNNNVKIDELNLGVTSLNYVGPNKVLLITIIISVVLLILMWSIHFIFKKKLKKCKYKSIYYNILYPLTVFLGLFLIIIIGFNKFIIKGISLLNKLQYQDETETKKVISENEKILVYPSYNSIFGELSITNLNINTDITFGDSSEILNKSIGMSSSSYFPGEGGTIIFSGHNSEDYLYNLKDIKKNDVIVVNTDYGRFKYKVVKTDIVKENDIIDVYKDKEELLIYTCYPFSNILYGDKRFIVYSNLIESEWY